LGALRSAGGGVGTPGAVAPVPSATRLKRSWWADGPPGGGSAVLVESAVATAPGASAAAARPGKEQVAGLRQAAEVLRSLGLLHEADALDTKAVARQAELDSERPIVDRFKAADNVVRHRSKEVAAAKAILDKAEEAAASARAAWEAAAEGLAAAEAEATKLRELLGSAGLPGVSAVGTVVAAADPSAGWAILAALLAGTTSLEEVRAASRLAGPRQVLLSEGTAAPPGPSQVVAGGPPAVAVAVEAEQGWASGSEVERARRGRWSSRSPRPPRPRAGAAAADGMDTGDGAL
jgi:hypothetical protein